MNDYTKDYFYCITNEITGEKSYFFRINGELVEVSEDVYTIIHSEYKHALYEYNTKEPPLSLDRDYVKGKDIIQFLSSKENPEEEAINAVLIELIKKEINKLDLIDRTIMIEYFFNQKSQAEISKIVGINQKNISFRIKKIITRLKKEFS